MGDSCSGQVHTPDKLERQKFEPDDLRQGPWRRTLVLGSKCVFPERDDVPFVVCLGKNTFGDDVSFKALHFMDFSKMCVGKIS